MHTPKPAVSLFWFRRDLRLNDNTGLLQALRSGNPVVPVFIFDRGILDLLEDRDDRRVEFIHQSLHRIQQALVPLGATLEVVHGKPLEVFQELLRRYAVSAVYANHDYEPYARKRDAAVGELLRGAGAAFHTFKDQVLFERSEVVKDDGLPYTVFTPYSRKWLAVLGGGGFDAQPSEASKGGFLRQPELPIPTLQSMGFKPAGRPFPPDDVPDRLISEYGQRRNLPAEPGTSRLGVHLRFGSISIRALARRAAALDRTFLNELIWRDFYHMILWHFPRVGEGNSFKPAYDAIEWRNDEGEFERWCAGTTGYPIVDAGMRELNETGFMHNRVRMITASFLSKHLLVDWRWGEAYFARRLLDFDLAANNGGWQWAAGSGCDAAPYFRVFNPALQTQKFDPKGAYLRQWVPEYEGFGYPKPIVDHAFARQRCLERYKRALGNG